MIIFHFREVTDVFNRYQLYHLSRHVQQTSQNGQKQKKENNVIWLSRIHYKKQIWIPLPVHQIISVFLSCVLQQKLLLVSIFLHCTKYFVFLNWTKWNVLNLKKKKSLFHSGHHCPFNDLEHNTIEPNFDRPCKNHVGQYCPVVYYSSSIYKCKHNLLII